MFVRYVRWTDCGDAGYRGVFDGCVWTLSQSKTHLLYTVQGRLQNSVNYDDTLSKYLRLSVPLGEHYNKWAAVDAYFEKCLNENNAVRILKQDVVETLFSFICSSNNNITRYIWISYAHATCSAHQTYRLKLCLCNYMLLSQDIKYG